MLFVKTPVDETPEAGDHLKQSAFVFTIFQRKSGGKVDDSKSWV
jgi:hypothetical protein